MDQKAAGVTASQTKMRGISPCRWSYSPPHLNWEAELIVCLVERQYVRRLLPDNLAQHYGKGQAEQRSIQLTTQPLAASVPLWISTLESDAELLVMVLSNQPSLMLVLLGITLERTDCLLLSV